MNHKTLTFGAALGAVGGMAMAMWSMVVLAATGDGFLTPVNLIAHAVWRGAPLDGTFNIGALLLGLMIHMAMSMMLGVGIAVMANQLSLSSSTRMIVAMMVPVAAWAGQLVLWQAVDPTGHEAFTPWVLFVGHVMFGMIAAAGFEVAERHSGSSQLRTAVHA